MFPLLGYASVDPITDAPSGPLGGDLGNVGAFEYGYVSPLRRALIEVLPETASAAAGTVTALTPQGYVATFTDGKLTAITLGEIDGVSDSAASLRFDGGGKELPQQLRDAFLANQQVIVMTQAAADLAATPRTLRSAAGDSPWICRRARQRRASTRRC